MSKTIKDQLIIIESNQDVRESCKRATGKDNPTTVCQEVKDVKEVRIKYLEEVKSLENIVLDYVTLFLDKIKEYKNWKRDLYRGQRTEGKQSSRSQSKFQHLMANTRHGTHSATYIDAWYMEIRRWMQSKNYYFWAVHFAMRQTNEFGTWPLQKLIINQHGICSGNDMISTWCNQPTKWCNGFGSCQRVTRITVVSWNVWSTYGNQPAGDHLVNTDSQSSRPFIAISSVACVVFRLIL